MKNSRRGFTLIELLVVIAIIGILSSVVLASLNSARAKGQDATIKSNLNNMRAQAALYYESNNGYGSATSTDTTVCATQLFADPTIANMVSSIKGAGNPTLSCVASSNNFAIQSELKSGGSWCIDYRGVATSSAISIANGKCGN